MAEKKSNGLTDGEKQAILKDIINRQNKDAVQADREKQKAITFMAHIDMSKVYEAFGNIFLAVGEAFNRFANLANQSANDFKDKAIQSLRELKDQDENDSDSN